jgi:hypothetical protein
MVAGLRQRTQRRAGLLPQTIAMPPPGSSTRFDQRGIGFPPTIGAIYPDGPEKQKPQDL